MKEIFNKTILDQLYAFRKEEFEKTVYEENNELKEIELKMSELSENFINHLKKVIPNENDLDEALKQFRRYELERSSETDFLGTYLF